MEDGGVSVTVTNGFIKSFAREFVERYGETSLLVRAVSDLWTTALARMLIEKGKISHSDPIALFADTDSLAVIRALSENDALKVPLLQEPLGYAAPGTIEHAFNSTFGAGSFEKWLSAFENRAFALCAQITGQVA